MSEDTSPPAVVPRNYYLTRCRLNYKLADQDRYLHEALSSSELQGYCEIMLIDPVSRQLRPTRMAVRYGYYTLDAELQYEKSQPAALYGVLAEEVKPAISPICWYLLSNYPIDNLEEAQTLIRYYSYQWCLVCVSGQSAEDTFGQNNNKL